MTIQQIAEARGILPKNVRQRLREQGVTPPPIVGPADLLASGLTIAEVVARGYSRGAVFKAASRLYGPRREARQQLTDAEWEWALGQLNEGVPANWVAESLPITSASLAERYRRQTGRSLPSHAEFKSVWVGILRNPEILKSHREFAPK
ncbi:hypothetical protein [Microbacterium sp. No. 7]|uniref:hypothetical protein n=1 Tax=Microbacterium sp. No. 7 TaxID=1714373 RepID=UPI0012E22F8B|nr:hypothetical protein [Microbacterium sp. No. 7]